MRREAGGRRRILKGPHLQRLLGSWASGFRLAKPASCAAGRNVCLAGGETTHTKSSSSIFG